MNFCLHNIIEQDTESFQTKKEIKWNEDENETLNNVAIAIKKLVRRNRPSGICKTVDMSRTMFHKLFNKVTATPFVKAGPKLYCGDRSTYFQLDEQQFKDLFGNRPPAISSKQHSAHVTSLAFLSKFISMRGKKRRMLLDVQN
ncbi:CDC6 [Acrasis kona]|uniref:CDC6 n=1 Tax=Acrasis kona TaxID=1008807 RepID=A0AAW2ZCA8_9EUKA